jgi:hypothetical protein
MVPCPAEWDESLGPCRTDGAALDLPFRPGISRNRLRSLFFARAITYRLGGGGEAELELVVASHRIWKPNRWPETQGWKVMSVGLGLVLAVRLRVFSGER